jgi:hypothetical protein
MSFYKGAADPVAGGPFRLRATSRRISSNMQQRSCVKKLLAYEKEVNEGFAKTA